MTDLDTLHRAFAELERRADAHAASGGITVRPAVTDRPVVWRRPVPAGATSAALVAAVVGVVVLTTDRAGPVADTAATGATTSAVAPAGSTSPATADVVARFRAALGGLATFTVTGADTPGTSDQTPTAPDQVLPTAPSSAPSSGVPSSGSYLAGVLTADGHRGGFDVQTDQGGGPPTCWSDLTECTVSTLADGSSLLVGTMTFPSPDRSTSSGRTQLAYLVRPDGTSVLFHVSNEQDPKGGSAQLSAEPPLTIAAMTTVVTSPAWANP